MYKLDNVFHNPDSACSLLYVTSFQSMVRIQVKLHTEHLAQHLA